MGSESTPISINAQLNAGHELGRIIDGLPRGPLSPRQQRNWERKREYNFSKYGEDSILSLFPERLDKDYRFLVMGINALYRAGVITKSDLIETRAEDITDKNGIGEKTLNLFYAMKNVAIVQARSSKLAFKFE